jgi:molybdate-binding protein
MVKFFLNHLSYFNIEQENFTFLIRKQKYEKFPNKTGSLTISYELTGKIFIGERLTSA